MDWLEKVEAVRRRVARDLGATNLEAVYLYIQMDLDKTLTLETAWTPAQALSVRPNQNMIALNNRLAERDIIIIYTARRDELMPATLKWLRVNDVRYDAISNLKRPAHVLVDDKAINPFDSVCHCQTPSEESPFP